MQRQRRGAWARAVAYATALCLAGPASAQLAIGVAESYEGLSVPTSGTTDNRGLVAYDRLVEMFDSWEAAGVDFGVLDGDNLANSESQWPLLEQAIQATSVPIYLVVGNHDWVNQEASPGVPHPDTCYNVPYSQQTAGCPNFLYLLVYLQNEFGFTTPWYSFEQDGALFVFLADDLFDKKWKGDGDISSEQFYWFRDLVQSNPSKPIVVFAHHPVYHTIFGSFVETSTLGRLGWGPKMGGRIVDGTVSVTNGSTLVDLTGSTFDPKEVVAGAEFQLQGETDWYTIAQVLPQQLVLTEPYLGATAPGVRYWAGSHWNELTAIFMDPANSIELMISGHTGGSFTDTDCCAGQLEVVAGKTFAYAGIIKAELEWDSQATLTVGSDTVQLDLAGQAAGGLGPFTDLQFGGVWYAVLNTVMPGQYGDRATLTLDQPIAAGLWGGNGTVLDRTPLFQGVDGRTESRLLEVDANTQLVHSWNYESDRFMGDLYLEAFESPVAPAWRLEGGDWLQGPQGPEGLAPDSGKTARALIGNTVWSRYEIRVTMARPLGGAGGILFRAAGHDDTYSFGIDDAASKIRLERLVAGQETVLAEVDLPAASASYELRVVARGDDLRAFVDGALVAIETDSAFPTGRVGLWASGANGAEFDDFAVYGDQGPLPVPEPSPVWNWIAAAAAVLLLHRSRRGSKGGAAVPVAAVGRIS